MDQIRLTPEAIQLHKDRQGYTDEQLNPEFLEDVKKIIKQA